MKIGDRTDFLETETVELMDGVAVTINGLPFGFNDDMEDDIPSPKVPTKMKRDKFGQFIYKDKKKKTVLTDPNPDDPKYKAEAAQQTKRQVAWIIYHGTDQDENLTWTANLEDSEKPEDFYQKIYDEMGAAKIGAGHIFKLNHAILELSGMTKDQLDRAQESFLAAEESET